jgi:hypothetical protein
VSLFLFEVAMGKQYLANCFQESIETWALLNPSLVLPRDVDDKISSSNRFLAEVLLGGEGGLV